MPVRFEKTNPPITHSDIDVVEAELGMKFPEQYKKFLLLINGGRVKLNHQLVPYHDKDLGWDIYDEVEDFCGILPRNATNRLKDIWQTYKRLYSDDPLDNSIPPECIPIAWGADGGHTFFGISITPDKYGKIFLWFNGDQPTYQHAHLIADSFDEFIDLIASKTPKDYDIEGKLIE